MSDHAGYPPPLGPLSAGNVVSAALRLYRDHFKAYFKVSLKAGLWSICPLVIFLIFILLNSLLLTRASSVFIFFFILLNIIVAVFVFIYCSAKYFTHLAIVSRLAFAELIAHPETVRQTSQQLLPKMFLFWKVNFTVGLLLSLINLGLTLAQWLLFDLPASLSSSVIGSAWKIIGSLIYLVVLTWFNARLFIAEIPLAVEDDLNSALNSVERSWLLTKEAVWRIALVISVAFLVTIPCYLLILIPLILATAQFIYSLVLAVESGTLSPLLLTSTLFLFSGIIISLLLINVLVIPFWQAVKSVVYYDLRSRREGLGIELR